MEISRIIWGTNVGSILEGKIVCKGIADQTKDTAHS